MFSLYADAGCVKSTKLKIFGIVDHPSGCQISNSDSQAEWIAVVENQTAEAIKLLAIDGCMNRHLDEDRKRCDGALIHQKQLILFELKETKLRQDSDGIAQIEDTIAQLQPVELKPFAKRIAYVCNKRHARFAFGQAATMEAFRSRTSFRLILSATIHIK